MNFTYKNSYGRQAPAPPVGALIMVDTPSAGPDGAGTNPDNPPIPYLVINHFETLNGFIVLIAVPGTARDLDKLKPGEFVIDRRDHLGLQTSLKFDYARKHQVPCVDRVFDIKGKVSCSVREFRLIDDDHELRLREDPKAERRGYLLLNAPLVEGAIASAKAAITYAELEKATNQEPERRQKLAA